MQNLSLSGLASPNMDDHELDSSAPRVWKLPVEILSKIASYLTPHIARSWLPLKGWQQYEQWKKQHDDIKALQLTAKRFAQICRLIVWKTVCFPPDAHHVGPQRLLDLDDVQPYVQTLHWTLHAEDLYMAPLLLPHLLNLKDLGFSPASLESDDNSAPLLEKDFTDALADHLGLKRLRLQGFAAFSAPSIAEDEFPNVMHLNSITYSNSWEGPLFPLPPRVTWITERPPGEAELEPTSEALVAALPQIKELNLVWVPRYSLDNEAGNSLSLDALSRMSDEARAELPLESFELSGYLLQGLVPVFQLLAVCESLRSIVFTDAPPGVKPEWGKLSMPFVQSLTVHMAYSTWSDSAALQAMLVSFPTLTSLDISSVICAPIHDYPSSEFGPAQHLSSGLRDFLQFIGDETDIERLVIRFPVKKQILHFQKDHGPDPEAKVLGFLCELWHEW